MRKRGWIIIAPVGLVLAAGTGAYVLTADGEVTVSSLCAPPASTPEYVATYAPTVVIGTVTGRTRYTPTPATPAPACRMVMARLTWWSRPAT
ncbi:hypothetical protein [Streptomyces anulatus]|uniref:hypothetical protein n=1 Tax=Streptomyces anulatus TaxID=1892 RepID=UPI001C26B2BF|nr:hypothetical protein [Streptomyces anulatus]